MPMNEIMSCFILLLLSLYRYIYDHLKSTFIKSVSSHVIDNILNVCVITLMYINL